MGFGENSKGIGIRGLDLQGIIRLSIDEQDWLFFFPLNFFFLFLRVYLVLIMLKPKAMKRLETREDVAGKPSHTASV